MTYILIKEEQRWDKDLWLTSKTRKYHKKSFSILIPQKKINISIRITKFHMIGETREVGDVVKGY